MRFRVGLLLTGAMLSCALQARADEIVYFTDGTYMHVLSHEVKGEMVRVRLDGDAALAIPSKRIEKIEGTYGVVYGGKASGLQANQAAPSQPATTTAETPYPVGVNPALAARANAPSEKRTPPVNLGGAGGVEESNSKYLDGSILGNRQQGPSGTTVIGGRTVIDSGKRPGGRSAFVPKPFQAKPGLAQPDPTTVTPQSPFPAPSSAFPNQGKVQDSTDRQQPVEEPAPDEPESEGGP